MRLEVSLMAGGLLLLAGCSKKEDPAVTAIHKYSDAQDCYGSILGYHSLASEFPETQLNAEKYDDVAMKASEYIEAHERDAPDWTGIEQGDAIRRAKLMARMKSLSAETREQRMELLKVFSRDAAGCEDKF